MESVVSFANDDVAKDDDDGCMTALAARLGHAAPFTNHELAAIRSLTVSHSRGLDALVGCTGLCHLRVIASEIDDLTVCQAMIELAHLEIHCSIVRSLNGIAACQKLERIDLLFTSVMDGRQLFVTAPWRRGTFVGNPWNQSSWDMLQEIGRRPGMLIQTSASTQDWQSCRDLWERVGACRGRFDDEEDNLVVRPGLPKFTANLYDALTLEAGINKIDALLRSPPLPSPPPLRSCFATTPIT
jgi:hypothetical protein